MPSVIPSATLVGVTTPQGPAFDIVLLLHVAAVLIGFGTVVVSGVQSARVLATARHPMPILPSNVADYYSPGVNWAGRVLYLVPVFGATLLALSGGAYTLKDAWVQWGIGLWVLAVLSAEALLWPSERRIQAELSRRDGGGVSTQVSMQDDPVKDRAPHPALYPSLRPSLERACRATCLWASVLAGLLVTAMVVMVARP